MQIGEIARKAGLTIDTVRFYERSGLIRAGEKEAGSRVYKTFDEEALERLLFIQGGQEGGFTLREIKEMLDNYGTDLDAMPYDLKLAKVEAKIAQTDEKIRRLEAIREHLCEKLARMQAGKANVG